MAPVRFSGPLTSFSIALAFVLGLVLSRQTATRANEYDTVRLADGTVVHLAAGATVNVATPAFLEKGKRYAFTWAGGGPPQTYTVKDLAADGWILVEVADEITRPELYVPGEFPLRWLHVGLAVSIQEMRPLP